MVEGPKDIWKPYINNPLIVALDVDNDLDAIRLADELKGVAGAYKVGPRLVVRYGSSLISRLAKIGPVFLDHKFLDIPSTMSAAVLAAFDSGATMTTVHSWAGPKALRELSELEGELNRIRPFLILSVTVLTSFSVDSLPPGLTGKPIEKLVDDLADSVQSAGLKGLVCSPHEIVSLRKRNSKAYLVTPGIRSKVESLDDQSRAMAADEAMHHGANAIVVGRPILSAASPLRAAENILKEIGF